MVKTGRYRHYKGKDYEVIGCARHSETEEEYVVYRALYGDRGLWVRPTALFMQPVTIEGRVMARFAPVREETRPTGKESVPADSAGEGGTSRRAGGRVGEMVDDMTPGAGGCDNEGARLTGKESVPADSAREDGTSTGKDTSWRVGGGRVKKPAGGRGG